MKRAYLVAVVGFLSLGAGLATLAQTSVYVVNVPFSFYVGDRQLPAGTYYIDSKRPFESSTLTLEFIRSGNDAGIALPAVSTVEAKEETNTPKLVFHEYGNVHFLTEFWNGHGRGKQLALSSLEREISKKQTPTDLSVAAN